VEKKTGEKKKGTGHKNRKMVEPEAKKAQIEERKKQRKEKLAQIAKKKIPPVKKTKKLSKWEWIQESAKEHVVPSKAFQEKKAAQRKLIQAKRKKRNDPRTS